MEKPEIRPPPSENAWTDGYQNWQGDYVPDIYPGAKLHYDPVRGFCPHICEVAYQMFTRLVFLGSSNSLPPRPLRRFWRSIRQKTSFHARMCLLGVPEIKSYILTLFSQKRKLSVDFRRDWKFCLKRASTWGSSSVDTPKTTSYAFGSWMMNRQIDPYKSKYVSNFYPGSRLTPYSAHARRIQTTLIGNFKPKPNDIKIAISPKL